MTSSRQVHRIHHDRSPQELGSRRSRHVHGIRHGRIQQQQQQQEIGVDPAKREMHELHARFIQELGGGDTPVVRKRSRRGERLGTRRHIVSAPPVPSQKKSRIVSPLQDPATKMSRLQPTHSPGFHFTTSRASRSASVQRPPERRERPRKVSRSRSQTDRPSIVGTRPVQPSVSTRSVSSHRPSPKPTHRPSPTPVRRPAPIPTTPIPTAPQRPRTQITDKEANATRLRLDEHKLQQQRDLDRVLKMKGLKYTTSRTEDSQRRESFSRNQRLQFIRKHSLSREREDIPEEKVESDPRVGHFARAFAQKNDIETRPETGDEGLTNQYSSVRRQKPKYLQTPSLPQQSFDRTPTHKFSRRLPSTIVQPVPQRHSRRSISGYDPQRPGMVRALSPTTKTRMARQVEQQRADERAVAQMPGLQFAGDVFRKLVGAATSAVTAVTNILPSDRTRFQQVTNLEQQDRIREEKKVENRLQRQRRVISQNRQQFNKMMPQAVREEEAYQKKINDARRRSEDRFRKSLGQKASTYQQKQDAKRQRDREAFLDRQRLLSERRQRQMKYTTDTKPIRNIQKKDTIISLPTKPRFEEVQKKNPALEKIEIKAKYDPLKKKKDLIKDMSEQWLQDMRMKYPSRGGYHPNNWLKVIGIEELQKEREKEQGKSGGTESFKEFAATFPTKHPKPTPDPVIKFRKLYEPPVEIKLDYDKKGKPKITRGVLSDNLQRVAEREKNRKIQEKREREQAIRLSDARIKAFEEKTNKRRLAEQKKRRSFTQAESG